jgi:C1A family cysteine protease
VLLLLFTANWVCAAVNTSAQDQGGCGACVGFAVTAAAEAAINVHLGQSWNMLSLSEQDLSFCRCE